MSRKNDREKNQDAPNKTLLGIRSLFLQHKQVILTTVILTVLADIVFIKESSDFRIFGLLTIYIACIFFYKLTSKFTFMSSLVILMSMYLEFIFTGTSANTEKAAVWIFFFLAVGIVQQFKE